MINGRPVSNTIHTPKKGNRNGNMWKLLDIHFRYFRYFRYIVLFVFFVLFMLERRIYVTKGLVMIEL